jgi:hypothetical protein
VYQRCEHPLDLIELAYEMVSRGVIEVFEVLTAHYLVFELGG